MSRVITLAPGTTLERLKYKTGGKTFRIGPISLNFLTISIISLLALFYLIQSQQAATKGYAIRELEKQKEEVVTQNEELQIEAAKLRSVENIKNTADNLGMIPTVELNYLNSQNLTRK